MTFAQYTAQSVSDARILVQLDIGQRDVQWVNWGAGLWAVNTDNLYSWVDASLLDGFTAQGFAAIGSVHVDGVLQTDAGSMLALVTTAESFWYDGAGTLWVHLVNHDAPSLHAIFIGVVYGYSFDEFTPVGAEQLYEGRLLGAPSISTRRDPLYFGRISFGGGSITLANGDGYFDSWTTDNDIYGNEARVYLGYDGLDLSEYERLYTGYIENVVLGEDVLEVAITDRRKQLTASITYTCTAQNALDAIVEILTTAYPVTYNDTYFDTTAWAEAQASVETVTISMDDSAPVIDVIEDICTSVFGVFFVTPDNKFSFRLVDTGASAETTIRAGDVMNRNRIIYNPSEVLSSARIGYIVADVLTYHDADQYEASVFNAYKTYSERTFDTQLDTVTAATAYGETIMQYTKDVHGVFEMQLPMLYYALEVGEMVDAEIWRAQSAMLATARSEILEVRYDLAGPTLTLGLRIA